MAESLRITVQEVKRRLDRGEPILFLDDRNPQAWAQSGKKLPGAIRVPSNELEQHLSEIPRNRPLVAYCT